MASKVFAKDTYVWLVDEEEGYVPAKVKATFEAGEKGTVMNLMTESTYSLSAAESKGCLAMDPQSLEPIADMVELKQLDEPALLHNLRLRYELDEIYTSIGTILVSVNPFKKLNIYSPQVVDDFIAKGAKELPPHIFGTADNAYRSLVDSKLSQSCIVSGESGAGKTEATKLFLQYLAEKSSAGDEEAKTGATMLHEKILEANPLMEAFGNAKTLRNDNSSRFGKLIQVDLDNKRGKIVGGNIQHYLLEKSRIVNQATGERNYHIFYQLCTFASYDPDFNSTLKLQDAAQYYYSNPNDDEDGINVQGMNDSNEFESTMNAMDVLEFNQKEKMGLMTAVAAILHLGNIEFVAVDEGSEVSPEARHILERTAELMGVDPDKLNDALVKRKVRELFKEHNVSEAIAARDAFAKATYGFMFDWLISKINKSLSSTSVKTHKHNKSSIAVLDIFGFESFKINSFEQLCINYCNEKLQSHFNEHIFALEQALYAEEGIELKRIDFTDNQPTLEKIEGRNNGVLAILDEVNRMPKGSDKVFLEKVLDQVDDVLLKKPDVKALRDPANRLVFSVAHYAGEVAYTVTNFLDKNKDRLLDDLHELGLTSKNPFIKHLFPVDTSNDNRKTLGSQFKGQLQELMDSLGKTEPHYVRTIKPNPNKVSNEYFAPMILDQMRCAGLMEVCRIRKLGYPVRKTFEEFYKRYKPLASDLVGVKDHIGLCKDLETNSILTEGEYQVGKTKVFMRDNQFNHLEVQRAGILGAVAIKIQKVVRGFVARRRFARHKKILKTIETAIAERDVLALKKALQATGDLPNLGNHLPIVQQAKKVLAQAQEEARVVELLKGAIAGRDLASLNSAITAAEKLGMKDHPVLTDATNLREKVIKEKECVEGLEAAVGANQIEDLKKAIQVADETKMTDHAAYKDAVFALRHLQEVEETIAKLDEAVTSKNPEEIMVYLTKMAELGKTDHPSVAAGQEITKEIAKASQEAEKQMKLIKKNLQAAIEREDLAQLKKLRPQVLKYGITGDLVERANAKVQLLEKKASAFSELSAAKQTLEIKYEGFDGVSAQDVENFSALITTAKEMGFDEDDEELSAMRDFAEKMQDQIKAQEFLQTVVKSKDEAALRKALAMVQDLGLRTGLAKEIEQEVQLLDQKQYEAQAEEREKLKEEVKKNLKEGDEMDREDEKRDMLQERTDAHKELISKAADTTKFHFSQYYKIREDADYVETLPEEAREAFAEKKLLYQAKNIPKSLIKFPTEISKIAVQVYKGILQYCGDLANPYPNTMAKFMIVTCLENPVVVDEVYLQLMKHLTENSKPVSEDRGWGLMCMMAGSVPPTTEFAPFLVNFLLQNKTVSGLIGNYARLCIVQLDGRIRLGATTLIPDLEVVDTYSQRPPVLAIINRAGDQPPMEVPVTPDEDIDRVLGDTIFPLLDIHEDDQHLYGLFVIDGRPDTNLDLRTRLTRLYQKYNPSKLPHVEYFVNAWGDNIEGLFHKLETKYGPEPTEEEVAQAMRKRGKAEKFNFLQLPITAALKAAKRLGLASGPVRPPPSPQTAWPVPWWVFPGDIYLRMVKQNRVPVFTFKRKLFMNGEPMSEELIHQNQFDVAKGNLAVKEMEDVVDLAAIHLTLKNNCETPGAEDLQKLGLTDVLPVTWLASKQPKEFVEGILESLKKLSGADEHILKKKYMQICRKQAGYGMWFFYLSKPGSAEITVAGVDTVGVHIMDEKRTVIKTTYKYRSIKEYGAGPTVFWMKVVKKDEKTKKTVEKLINLNTLQAWDLYGLVYDYTFNAEKLNLK